MQKRFKPLLAAAVAAGAIPLFESITDVHAATVTAAAFNFDTQTSPAATAGSVSFTADSFSPGYGGSLTGTLTNTTGSGWAFPNGNGSAKSIEANSWSNGGYYSFMFDIDDLNSMVLAFDMRSSNTAPAQFLLQTSLDGSVYNTFATITLTQTAAWSTNATQTSGKFTYTLPGSFSDTITGVDGQLGYLKFVAITGATAAVSGGAVSNSGGNRIDNVLITGQSVPEPSALIMTLAAAAGMAARPKRRDLL